MKNRKSTTLRHVNHASKA